MNIYKIIEVLRKDNKTMLWNKLVKNWDFADWKEFRHLQNGTKPTKKETRKIVQISTGIIFNSAYKAEADLKIPRQEIYKQLKNKVEIIDFKYL